MKVLKYALLITLPLLLVVATILAVTHSTKFKTTSIERHYGIELPDEVDVAEFDLGLYVCNAHIIIPEAKLTSVIDSFKQAGYYEVNETDTLMGYSHKWDYDRSKIIIFYERIISKLELYKLQLGTSSVTMECCIVYEDVGFVSIYFS